MFDFLMVDKENLRIMKYKLIRRINHSFIDLFEDYVKMKVLRRKVFFELTESIDEKNLFIEKKWESFPDERSLDRKIKRIGGNSDRMSEKFLPREFIITKDFLRNHQECIFVFGDNLIRQGYKGAAKMRDEINSYGFITKKFPSMSDSSFYKESDYVSVFSDEWNLFTEKIKRSPDKLFLISRLGAGLANKYNIYEKIILDHLINLLHRPVEFNILFLFPVLDDYYNLKNDQSEPEDEYVEEVEETECEYDDDLFDEDEDVF